MYEIRLNGETVISGDKNSVCVVFNQLTGANFEKSEKEEYASYLVMISNDFFKFKAKVGDLIELFVNDQKKASATIGDKSRITSDNLI